MIIKPENDEEEQNEQDKDEENGGLIPDSGGKKCNDAPNVSYSG